MKTPAFPENIIDEPQEDNHKYKSKKFLIDYLNRKKNGKDFPGLLRKAIEEAIKIQNSVDRAIALINIIAMTRYDEKISGDKIWPLEREGEDAADIAFKSLSEEPAPEDIERHVFACVNFIAEMARLGLKGRLFALEDSQGRNIMKIAFDSADKCELKDKVRLFVYLISILTRLGVMNTIDTDIIETMVEGYNVTEYRVYLIPAMKYLAWIDISIQDEFKRVQGISIQIKPVERAEYFIELITMLVLAQETEQLSVLKDSGKNIIELAIDSIKAINHGVTKAELSIDLVNILTQVQEQKTISNMDEYIDTLISIAYTCSAEITDLVKIRLFTHLLISLARAGFSQKIEEYGLLVEIRRSINSAVQKVDMAKLVQLREELNQYLLDALYSLVYYQKPSGEVEEKEINIDELRAVLQKIVVELARLNRPVPVKTIDIPDEFIAALWQASTIKEPVYIQDSLRVLAGCIKLIEKLSARSKYFKELIEYIEKFQDKLGLDKDGLISYWERMDVDKHVLTEKKSESSANNFQLRNLTQVQEAQMLIGQAI